MNPLKEMKKCCGIFPAKLIIGLTIFLFINTAGVTVNTIQSGDVHMQDSLENRVHSGMRLRKLPENKNKIFEPVIVQNSPGNEATVLRLESGEIKIFFINRPGKADKLMSISSLNNGITWEEPKAEFSLPGEAYYANAVVRDKMGELHCIFHIFGDGENGYNGRHLDLYYCGTKNKGTIWSKPEKIYDGYVGSIRSFIQLKNGRLLVVFARAVPSRYQKPGPGETDHGWNEIISMYSDDLGETWLTSENGINIPVESSQVTRYGGVEPSVIELNDGRVWMLIRTNKGCLYESSSDNSGKTWLSPEPTNFISSDSPAALLRLNDGRIIIIWSCNQRWNDDRSYANGGREVLHAAISGDEGRSWKGYREVLVSPEGHFIIKRDIGTAYPSAVETKEGKVLFVSGQGEEKAIVIFDPDWLERKNASDNFSNGLVQWTLFGAESIIGVAPVESGKKEHALLIRKMNTVISSDAEAVWNFPMTQKGKLILDVIRNKGSKGIKVALTDHFSVSYDTLASENSIISFQIKENIIEKESNNIRITITWDRMVEKASVEINNKSLQEIKFRKKPNTGLNYLRMGIPGHETDNAGYLLKSVKLISK
jgi:hypothetical protein